MSEFLFSTSSAPAPCGEETPCTLGFLVSDMDPGYYGELLNTLKEVCKPLGARLVVFEGRALQSPLLAPKCYNTIYEMVSQQRLDGLLVATSGMGATCGPEILETYLSALTLPVITIGMPLASRNGVGIDDANSVTLLLDHMVRHGYRRIAWASGPPQVIHSQERLVAYRDWLLNTGSSLGIREDVHFGNFSARSGYEIMSTLHRRVGKDLDAACFSNDSMALGALEYCNSFGIHVPEDLAIGGIDNTQISGLVNPSLTTVSQNMPRIAQIAVHELLSRIRSLRKEEPVDSGVRHLVAAPTLVTRRSCGCESRMTPNRNVLLQDMMYRNLYIGESVQTFQSETLFAQMEQFLRRKAIQACFVVVYEESQTLDDDQPFVLPKHSRLLLGFMNDRRLEEQEPFPTLQLLPDRIWEAVKQTDLMVKPLFFEKEILGYMVSSAEPRERPQLDDLRLMISVTLRGETLIKEIQQTHRQLEWALDAMKSVNRQLSDISQKDELTGLLNRRGFIQEATRYINGRPKHYLLGFADMNGLKLINDQYGHEEGDRALKEIRDILKHCCRENDIIARVSGDEYAFLLKDADAKQQQVMEKRFEERMAEVNAASGKPYPISFARGYATGGPDDSLETLMKESDARMYVHKAWQKSHGGVPQSRPESSGA